MKKTRFLVLALAVAVMLVGAGYAWWSETVTITSTVSTGNLDVDIVNPTGHTYYKTGNSSTGTLDDTYSTVEVVPAVNSENDGDDKDALTVNFKKLYPGSYGEIVIPIKNTGTVAAKLDRSICAFENLDANTSPWCYDFVDVRFSPSLTDDNQAVTLIKDDGGQASGHMTYNLPSNKVVFVNKGETVYVKIKAELPTSVDRDELKENISFKFEPEFVQFNR